MKETDQDGRVTTCPQRNLYQVHLGHGTVAIAFQDGSPATEGLNGLTNENLINILIHRIDQLNLAVPCGENVEAISGLRQALSALELRAERVQREAAASPD